MKTIKRGGQDVKKIYAAFNQALTTVGKPTVILIKTVKGDGMGLTAQGRNSVHQKKNLSEEERFECARRYRIPLSTEQIKQAEFYLPPEDSEEIQYLREHRENLEGYCRLAKSTAES